MMEIRERLMNMIGSGPFVLLSHDDVHYIHDCCTGAAQLNVNDCYTRVHGSEPTYMHCIDLLLNSTYEHVIVISKRTSILYTNDYIIMSMIANIKVSYDYLALMPAYLEMSVHDCCDCC
jgi:hypothetical protein